MTIFNSASAIGRLTLGAAFVLALAFSGRAHAAATYDGAMNQGFACLRAHDFATANVWFASARRSRPNSRAAMFWISYAGGCQQAQIRQYVVHRTSHPRHPGAEPWPSARPAPSW